MRVESVPWPRTFARPQAPVIPTEAGIRFLFNRWAATKSGIPAANADKVAEYKSGKQQLFGFFVGQTMKAMQGKANPQVVNERLRAKLD